MARENCQLTGSFMIDGGVITDRLDYCYLSKQL